MSRLRGWSAAPHVGVVVPREGEPGWTDAAFWCALLEAWGIPATRTSPDAEGRDWTTLVVPVRAADRPFAEKVGSLQDVSVLLTGEPLSGVDRFGAAPNVVRFPASADDLGPSTSEDMLGDAWRALAAAAPRGLVSIWRWPDGKDVALVVDGDVDHPTGVDPECARYVAPAIETAQRAGFHAYGIFATAANVDAEPASFPNGVDYYNHSYTHPYSYWNDEPWDALDADGVRQELTRSNDTFRRRLGADDQAMFRLPHFQLTGYGRTYDVLEELGYRAESSIGGNVSITGSLPFHPARRPWSQRAADAGYARTHPEPSGRRPFLQVPISTDPTDPSFPHGCCSYHTLGEGVRNRTASPAAYEEVLQDVLDRATADQGLAHLFIDPPDAGFGRLPGDRPDYASAVERWLARAVGRPDVAVMTLAELATWWLAREGAIGELSLWMDDDVLVVDAPAAPAGATLGVLRPGGEGTWERIPLGEDG